MRTPAPLAVAVAVALLGGTGNVAFTLHQGSQTALTLTRFAAGLALTLAWLAIRRPTRPNLRTVRHPNTHLAAAGTCNAGAITLVIAAAPQTSVLTLTILGLTTPAIIAAGARWMRLARATPRQIAYAAIALAAAAVASHDGAASGADSITGIAIILTATLIGVVGTLTSVQAAAAHHPVTILAATCAAGTLMAAAAGAYGAGGGLVWGPGTTAAALYIALIPGGIGKAGLLWAQARTAPHIVSAIGSASIITAGALGWLLLDQKPTATAVAAAAIIAVAVAGITINEPRREAAT